MGSLAAPLEQLQEELRQRLPDAEIRVDAPTVADGTWWIDVESQGKVATIEWRPKIGFGVGGTGGGYGEGPDIVVGDAESAANHVISFLDAGASDTQKRTRVS